MLGLDVSNNQGIIDWGALHAARYGFVFIKASEGATYRDRYLGYNLRKAEDLGLRTGVYHFARPTAFHSLDDARAEARAFVRFSRAAHVRFIDPALWRIGGRGSVGVLDFEVRPYSTAWVAAWAREFRRLTGARPGIYGSWPLSRVGAALRHYGFIWVAAWGRIVWEYIPAPRHKVWVWQFSPTGRTLGVNGHVDVNRWIARVPLFPAWNRVVPVRWHRAVRRRCWHRQQLVQVSKALSAGRNKEHPQTDTTYARYRNTHLAWARFWRTQVVGYRMQARSRLVDIQIAVSRRRLSQRQATAARKRWRSVVRILGYVVDGRLCPAV